MRPLYRIVVLFLFLIPAVSLSAEDWIVDGRFRLCLRQDGKEKEGHAFLFRDDGSTLGCMRGFYSFDVNKKRLTMRFPEAWYGTRNGNEIWWSFILGASALNNAPTMEFEYTFEDENLILTHVPRSGQLLQNKKDYFRHFKISSGEIIEFTRAKRIGLTSGQMPPSLNESTDHLNRYKKKKTSVWRIGEFVNSEYMLYVADTQHQLAGLSAIIFDAKKGSVTEGVVWIVHNNFPKNRIVAGRGTFSISNVSEDSQALDIQMSFPRTYRYQGGKGASAWRADMLDETGFTLRLPLTDREIVEPARAYVRELFFINAKGKREKRFVDQGIIEELINGAMEQSAYPCLTFSTLNSFEIRPLAKLQKLDSPESTKLQSILVEARPPGFKQATIKKVVSSLSDAKKAESKGDTRSAIKAYRKHLEKNPNDETTLLKLAKLVSKDSPGEAAAVYRSLCRIKPTNGYYQFQLGYLLQQQGQHNQAIRQYDLAYKHSKDKKTRSVALSNKGLALTALNRSRDAFDAYSLSYRTDRMRLKSGTEATMLWLTKGNDEWPLAACKEFAKTVNSKRNSVEAKHLSAAAAYFAQTGDFGKATELQQLAVRRANSADADSARNYLKLYENKVAYRDANRVRTWTMSFADVKHVGVQTGMDGSSVILKTVEGEEKRIPIDMLSKADQDYARNFMRNQRKGKK